MSVSTAAAIRPTDEAEVEAAIGNARASATPLEIVGGGTKRGLGRPTQTAGTLSLARLSGITLYEPSELVIAARAGTPLSDIEAALGEKGQRLAFEPPRLSRLYGGDGKATIGAVAACNLSGPRRVQAGAARDALIGVRLVTGRGEAIKSGGRVMKNVTGYDLVRLAAGSHGTLGVLTEVTFKVLPTPETEATLVLEGLGETAAVAGLARALGTPWEVTGAAHLPPDDKRGALTFVRIEGFESQISYRSSALARALEDFGTSEIVHGDESRALWRDVAELGPLGDLEGRAVWRISTTPSKGAEVAAAIRSACDARLLIDWGGGLLWATVPAEADACAGAVRSATGHGGGHATLMRAPDDVRSHVEVFEPQPEPVMELTRRLKESFDPDRILNPGRMYAGV